MPRTQRIRATAEVTASPFLEEAATTFGPSVVDIDAIHPAPAAEGYRATAVRDLVSAIRYVAALIKQLPLQPFVAALVVSLMLGAVPMLLTATYSAAHALAELYRRVFHSRTCAGPLVALHRCVPPLDVSSAVNPSMDSTLLHELLDQPELQ